MDMECKRPLRVGMIGTGNICLQHAQALRWAQHPAEIVALYNHNADKLKAFPELFSAQSGMSLCDAGNAVCQLFTSLEEMLDKVELDLVYVTTPHPTHVDMALPVVERGMACMIEKPLDVSIQKARALQAAAAKSGAYIGVIAQSRFFPAVERIAGYLAENPQDEPTIGVVNVMAWRDESYYRSNQWRGSWASEGGGVLVNQSVHELDLLCHFLGKVKSVYGIWRNINHPYIEVDDTAQAVVTFESGAVANILVSNSVNPAYKNYVRVVTRSGQTLSITTHEGVEANAGLAPYLFRPYNDVFTPVSETTLQTWKSQAQAAASQLTSAQALSLASTSISAPASESILVSKSVSSGPSQDPKAALGQGAGQAHGQSQGHAQAQGQDMVLAQEQGQAGNAVRAKASPFPYFTLQFDNFAEAILTRQPQLIRSNLETALGCMEIFQGIYLSSKLGRPVTVDEIFNLAP